MNIKKIINEEILKIFNRHKITINEVKYFSSDGNNELPDGVFYQKGFYVNQCNENKKNFKTNNQQNLINENFELIEAIHPEQYGLSDYRGGIIIFSTDVNAIDTNKNKIYNWFNQKIKTFKNRLFSKKRLGNLINKFNDTNDKTVDGNVISDYIGAFSIGNFFSGRYIGDNNKVYDEKSLSIEINGISSNALMFFAEEVAIAFNQETVLVKDLNKNKIFLVNSDRSGSYDQSNINKLV